MDTPPSPYNTEYEQVNDNIRTLADIRFKLLALIPPLGGVAIFLLSQAAVAKRVDPPAPAPGQDDYALVFLLALMGLCATLGITIYDQRNTELYNALVGRAKRLERRFKLVGGQFRARPSRGRSFFYFIVVGHDTGLALIYGTVLGAWFFPIAYSGLRWAHLEWPDTFAQINSFRTALLVSLIAALVFVEKFLRVDGAWGEVRDWIHKKLLGDKSTLKEIDLFKRLRTIRNAITSYKKENGFFPERPEDLVEQGYLDEIPRDPMTDQGWDFIREGVPLRGIENVCSKCDGVSSRKVRLYTRKAGKAYREW